MGANLSRHLARFLAIQYFFTTRRARKLGLETGVFEPNTLLAMFEADKFDTKLYEFFIDGVEEHADEINKVIKTYAPKRPLEEINSIDLIILQIAIYESFMTEKTPPKVAINEAIELAKAFGNKENGGFVNGVLGSLYNDKNAA